MFLSAARQPFLRAYPASLQKNRSSKSFPCHSYEFFHSPYPLSPLFATLTQTAGVSTNNSHCGTRSRSIFRTFLRSLAPIRRNPLCLFNNLRTLLQLGGGGGGRTVHPRGGHNDRMPRGLLGRIGMRNKNQAWAVIALLSAALLHGPAARAQQGDFSKVQIKTTKVSGNIYMLEGAGGNIAASVGEDGIVIVDDQFAPLADKIQAALKDLKITDKPVRFVINTHYHGDHTGGNELFSNAGSTLIAQDNVRKRLQSGGEAGNGGSIKLEAKPAPKAALPIITFDHDVTVHLNGEDIRALHFPAGHTDGDSIIFFPKNNVVHMGDDFVRYGFPFIDVSPGAAVEAMIPPMEKAPAQLPADVKVIPGHGALSNLDDVRAYTQMLKETSAAVQKALADKKTLAQMKEEKILAPWSKWSGDFINEDTFIETLYNSLTGRKGEFMKHN